MDETITSITLVRNGREKLRRAIRSVRQHVDQVLVVDTGSEDDSIQVARNEQATVLEIEWPDAFDAAFNFAFDQVTSGWVLRLDYDEWFEEDQAARLPRLAGNSAVFGYNLVSRNLDGDGGYCETLALRLSRAGPRYQGVCHETFPPDAYRRAAAGRATECPGLWYWHDGYTREAQRHKLLRDLGNVERELELRPRQLKYEIARGELLHLLGRPEGTELLATICGRSSLDQSLSPPSPLLAIAFWTALEGTLPRYLHSLDTSRMARQAARWFGSSPQMRYVLARFESRRQRPRAALEHLLALEAMRCTGEFDRSLRYSPEVLGKALWVALEQTASALGRADIAARAHSYIHPGRA